MKLIIAIIRPERLQAVQDALQKALDEGDNYRLTVSTVDGHYTAYGQKLAIDRGVITFTGPVNDPRLDIEATRVSTNRDMKRSMQ